MKMFGCLGGTIGIFLLIITGLWPIAVVAAIFGAVFKIFFGRR